jgi:hypothetical protein
MMGNSLLLQVLTAGLAIGIVITYIQPTIGTIRTHQDDIAKIQEEADTIMNTNAKLIELYNKVNEIPQRDKAALLTYLPDEVDDVRVLKDLNSMGEDTGVLMGELNYGGIEPIVLADETTNVSQPDGHLFNVSFMSSYEQFKDMLGLLERNNYPFLVRSLGVTPTEGGLLSVKLVLVTYSYKE